MGRILDLGGGHCAVQLAGLGQLASEVLSSTDVGKGLVLGFAVAFMGLMDDHLILTWSRLRKQGASI